jgi:tape measure domain-containing protein
MPDASSSSLAVERRYRRRRGGLRRISGEFTTTSGEAQKTVASINGLTERLGFQSRELGLLQQQHEQSVKTNGLFDAATQSLQLRIDKLTSAIDSNKAALAGEQESLKKLQDTATASGQAASFFEEIWTGALRQVGSLGVQALQSAVGAIEGFVQAGVESAGVNEQLTGSYQTMIATQLRNADSSLTQAQALSQSSGQAQELLKWTQQLAINSPFDAEGVAKSLQTAQAYGFTADEAKRLTQAGADFVAGSGRSVEAMNSIELALGQIQAKGKLSGQEVLQLVNAGLPVTQILADAFGKTTAEVQKLQEQGLIPAKDAIGAITGYMETNFAGAAQRMAGSIQGLGNSLGDLYKQSAADLLTPAIREVQPLIQQLVDTLQTPEARAEIAALGQTLGDVAETVIPAAVAIGNEFVATMGDLGTQLGPTGEALSHLAEVNAPLWAFVRDTAIPAGLNLAALFEGSLLQGVNGFTQSLVSQAEALQHVVAPLQTIASVAQQAYGAATAPLQAYHENLLATVDSQLQATSEWKNSTDALNATARQLRRHRPNSNPTTIASKKSGN